MRLDTPKNRARVTAYWKRRAEHRAAVDALTIDELVGALLARNAGYQEALLRNNVFGLSHIKDIYAGLLHTDEVRRG